MRRVHITSDGSPSGRELAAQQKEKAIAQADADGVDRLEIWTTIYVDRAEQVVPGVVEPPAPKELTHSELWTHPQLEGTVEDGE
jgi:hypothetical protein